MTGMPCVSTSSLIEPTGGYTTYLLYPLPPPSHSASNTCVIRTQAPLAAYIRAHNVAFANNVFIFYQTQDALARLPHSQPVVRRSGVKSHKESPHKESQQNGLPL